MQYMALIYIDPALAPPMSDKMNAEYLDLTKRMREAGVMKGGDALHPPATATSIKVRGGKVETMDGPFAETKELLAGFWIWKVKSKEEAIEWVKRVPMPMAGGEAEIEIRQIFDMEDFGEAMTPELREQEERQRAALAG